MLPRVHQSEVGVVPGKKIFTAVDGHFGFLPAYDGMAKLYHNAANTGYSMKT